MIAIDSDSLPTAAHSHPSLQSIFIMTRVGHQQKLPELTTKFLAANIRKHSEKVWVKYWGKVGVRSKFRCSHLLLLSLNEDEWDPFYLSMNTLPILLSLLNSIYMYYIPVALNFFIFCVQYCMTPALWQVLTMAITKDHTLLTVAITKIKGCRQWQ